MDGLLTFLNNTWPVLGALTLVGVITWGATMPYIRADRKRRARLEQDND